MIVSVIEVPQSMEHKWHSKLEKAALVPDIFKIQDQSLVLSGLKIIKTELCRSMLKHFRL